MQMIVLSIHLVVCVCLIGLVLMQRSEGGALGMGGGSGALMSGRGAADALARMTQVAGGFFIVTSLLLTVISGAASHQTGSVFDSTPVTAPAPVVPTPTPSAPVQPARPDPTQSSAPQAVPATHLASALTPGPATAEAATFHAPPPAVTGLRAVPLQAHTATTQPASVSAAPAGRTTTTAHTTVPAPAATNSAPITLAHTPPRTGAATTQTASTSGQATHPATHQLILPGSPGSVALTNSADQALPESSDPATSLQPVRRERAGPDQ
jgi:preprotein translocase subunit SecG